MPKKPTITLPIYLSNLPLGDVARAAAEDLMVEKILREARSRPPAPMVTEKSIRDGERFRAEMHRISQATLLSRIERGELITRDELITRLGGNRRWVTDAVKSDRLFAAPSGGRLFTSILCRRLL